MKKINTLSDLMMEELADLLNADSQLVEALPKMAQASESPGLKTALEEFTKITKEHVRRLLDIFGNTGQDPQGVVCNSMKGLVEQGEDAISKTGKSSARDAAIIGVAQRMEGYEINKYKTAREHAADLGHTKIVELFTKTLNEQRAMNFHLNELAQYMINVQATNPLGPHQRSVERQETPFSPKTEGGGFYIRQGRFGRKGIKKKKKNTDVSRFIDEGNPNTQDQNIQNPPEQDDLS